MDEPTTHLDISSIDALLAALQGYDGTLVFISHDVYFIRALAQTVLHVHSGRLTPYAGNYDYYLDKSKATNERAALTAGFTDARPLQNGNGAKPAPAPAKAKDQKRAAAEDRAGKTTAIKHLRVEMTALEKRISELEKSQGELVAALEAPETYNQPGRAQQLNRELSTIVDQLQAATTDWEAAGIKLTALEA